MTATVAMAPEITTFLGILEGGATIGIADGDDDEKEEEEADSILLRPAAEACLRSVLGLDEEEEEEEEESAGK